MSEVVILQGLFLAESKVFQWKDSCHPLTSHLFMILRNSFDSVLVHCVCVVVLLCGAVAHDVRAEDVLLETEAFDALGGWKLDTQFIQQMGSPYLLAHGLGKPVEDAISKFQLSQEANYRVWIRTVDWVAVFGATPSPGQFQLLIDGKPLSTTFGIQGEQWSWQDGGTVRLAAGTHELRLHDLTGFDGRCDCVYLTTDLMGKPPQTEGVLSDWRRKKLGLPKEPTLKSDYDLVVVGGGYSGMGAALAAARMGCRVALIQERNVLGGNGSSEVRVWAMGKIRRGRFPRIGEIIEEFCDHATKSPGTYEEFGDPLKQEIIRAEPHIDLMLGHHAYGVEMDRDHAERIANVKVLNVRTSEDLRVHGTHFVDGTGHGWLGKWAAADVEMTPKGRMGMSNMWRWDEVNRPRSFPETPWALDLNMEDFPYPRDHHGEWFWESGFDVHPIDDAEQIRDWNLRAVYGAFNAMKNRAGSADHENAELTWVAYIGGPRESLQIRGDVVLNKDDIVAKREFPDGCVPTTWSIDLHYPKKQYAKKYPDNPFISIAVHDRRVDRMYGYPVPYRCFYSRNIENLFMAGRCASFTHEALGTVRVMRTCGMMGEVVGKAASLCSQYGCTPRQVYEEHLDELLELLRLPGKARRQTLGGTTVIPRDAMKEAGPNGPMPGTDPAQLVGIVVDDRQASFSGKWQEGTGLKGFVGWSYRYASSASHATATFETKVSRAGRYHLQVHCLGHENRGTTVPLEVQIGSSEKRMVRINQRDVDASGVVTAGTFDVPASAPVKVTFSTNGAGGIVHVDAIRWTVAN